MNEEQARERIEELREFYAHVAAYVAVNAFLLLVNLITSPGFLWFVFPLGGWGIGLAIHAVTVFWTGNDWEARKMEELTGLKQTQDELQRLSDRTDALVTILASVEWENIDPELLRTRDNLQDARERVARLKTHADANVQEEVREEIEKLEAFVTSSEFAYYDKAAKGQ